MKKVGLLFLVLVMLGCWIVKDSEAAQWCWQFTEEDFIKLSVERNDPIYPFWSLNGVWYEGICIVPLVGTMVKSADGTEKMLTLYGTSIDARQILAESKGLWLYCEENLPEKHWEGVEGLKTSHLKTDRAIKKSFQKPWSDNRIGCASAYFKR